MNIVQINYEEVKNKFDVLVELHYENACLSFPNKEVPISYAEERIKQILQYIQDEKAFVFVAKENEVIIGFAWCYPRKFFDEDRIFVNSLIVKEEYRNKQIGKNLLEEIEKFAIQKKYTAVDLTVAAFNENGRRFYEKNGFEEERIQLVKKVGK